MATQGAQHADPQETTLIEGALPHALPFAQALCLTRMHSA